MVGDLEVGECYEMIGGTYIAIISAVAPSTQGGEGSSHYVARDLLGEGKPEDFVVYVKNVKRRMKKYEVGDLLFRQGWRSKDIVDYLRDLGLDYSIGLLSSYASLFKRNGSCRATNETNSTIGKESVGKLKMLNELVKQFGGTSRAIRCLDLIDLFGGTAALRKFISMLQ